MSSFARCKNLHAPQNTSPRAGSTCSYAARTSSTRQTRTASHTATNHKTSQRQETQTPTTAAANETPAIGTLSNAAALCTHVAPQQHFAHTQTENESLPRGDGGGCTHAAPQQHFAHTQTENETIPRGDEGG